MSPQTIAYDESGNPVSYLGATLTWKNGRQLASYTKGTKSVVYEYNESGLRTKKTVNKNGTITTYNYTWSEDKLTHQVWGNCYLHFYYDYNDEIIGFEYFDGTTVEYYTYVKNMQGDVVAIIDSDGVIDTTYEYDAWGRSKGSSGGLDVINPIRYRGYYYDEEISMYYLQSRYYDPAVGRFINADDVIVLMLFKISNNQYAYCNNNPIIRVDPYGYESITVYGLTVTLNSNGFSVDVNWIFFSKVLCLEFAEDVIELAGDGKKYKKMRRVRIAQELLAHALLYFLGEGMLRAKKVSDDIRKYFSDATIKKVLKKFAKIYSTIGEYLYLRSKTIDVNNNEKWYRMLAFKALWYIYPTF